MGVSSFPRSMLRVFTSTRRKPSRPQEYLLKYYPRVYRLLVGSIARGECPLCGLQLKARVGLAPHLKSKVCRRAWMDVVNAMTGRDRLSEEEVIELINGIRRRNGLPPIEEAGLTMRL